MSHMFNIKMHLPKIHSYSEISHNYHDDRHRRRSSVDESVTKTAIETTTITMNRL